MTDEFSKRIDLVIEGGGVKGTALAGALSVLEERGFQPQNVAGTSAGAIVAALIAAGYNAKALADLFATEKLGLIMDKGWEDRFPDVVALPLSILLDQGIFEGDYFQRRMQELLEAKGVRTFGDLVLPEFAGDPQYRYKVQVIVSDLTERRLLVLPRDAEEHLGIPSDDLNVALAVRMSMSFPFFFEPVKMRNPRDGKEHTLIDGGLLSNFPVWLFDSDGTPAWPTFGIRLVEDDIRTSVGSRLPAIEWAHKALGPIVPFVLDLVSTSLEAHDRMYIENAQFARTIPIPTLGVSTLDFDLPAEDIQALHDAGREAAEKFLDTWDFDSYIATFRSGKEHSRRQSLNEQMAGVVE